MGDACRLHGSCMPVGREDVLQQADLFQGTSSQKDRYGWGQAFTFLVTAGHQKHSTGTSTCPVPLDQMSLDQPGCRSRNQGYRIVGVEFGEPGRKRQRLPANWVRLFLSGAHMRKSKKQSLPRKCLRI
jgi:hypothetical protein